jgi:hypothetical protein
LGTRNKHNLQQDSVASDDKSPGRGATFMDAVLAALSAGLFAE